MTETVTTGTHTKRTADTDEHERPTISNQQEHSTAADQQAALASVRVIEAVADLTDADPLAMAPLSDAIDPDALDSLVEADFDGHVQFAYAGYDVTVRGDEPVSVAARGE